MLRLLILSVLLLSAAPAWATGPYFWAAPSGTHNITGQAAFCDTIDSLDTTTDPGVYGTIQAAAFCKKTTGLGGIIIKGSLGAYSGANHALNLFTMGTTALLSGTSDTARSIIMGAPGEAIPTINIECWYQQTNNSGAQRNWGMIRDLLLDPGTSSGCNPAEIVIYGDDNIIDSVTINNAWNVAVFFACYVPAGQSACSIVADRDSLLRSKASNFGRDGAGLILYTEGNDTIAKWNECLSGKGGCIQAHNANAGLSSDNPIIAYNYSHGINKQTQAGFSTTCRAFSAIDGRNALVTRNVANGRTCTSSGSTAGWGIDGGEPPSVNVILGYNNTIFNYVSTGIILGNTGGQSNNSIITNNLLLENAIDGVGIFNGTTGVVQTTNVNNGLVATYLVGDNSPWIKPGSAAINAGTAIAGQPFNVYTGKTKPDQGAFETFSYASASINQAVMDVTLGMNLNTPVLPATGMTGFTVACSGSNCGTPVVSNAVRLTGTDSIVRLTLTGITNGVCEAGQTWTVSYSAGTGNVTDSALIGNVLNQPMTAFTTKAVTNGCAVGAPPADPGSPTISYLLDENTGTTAVDAAGGDANGTLTGGPTWTTGHSLYGVNFANDTTDRYIAVPYGSGVNPTTQSLTVCLAVLPDAGTESTQKVMFGTTNGTNQRFYIGRTGGKWGIGIQSSGLTVTPGLPVTAGWTRLCLVATSGTNTAQLFVNGVPDISKTYTSFTLAANMRIGNDGTNSTNNGGSTIDDFKVYTAALSAANILTEYQGWQPVTPPPAATFAQVAHQFNDLYTAGGHLGAVNASISARAATGFSLDIQVDGTVANPVPIGTRLHVSRQGGAYAPVQDNCADNTMCFYGTTTDPLVVNGAPTCPLSGVLTCITGSTNYTMSAIPIFDLAQDNSVVLRYVLKSGINMTDNDTFDFKLINQDGSAFNPDPPAHQARVTVTPTTAISAPSNLHAVGAASNNIIELVWAPVTDATWAGYKVYVSTTSGVYGSSVGPLITAAGAAATHSSPTTWRTVVGAAGTYYFVVTAVDNSGHESVVSNEISVVRTGIAAPAVRVP